MATFEFSLQTALDLRTREERAAQQRLSDAVRAADSLRDELGRVTERQREVVEMLRTGAGLAADCDGADVPVTSLVNGQHYLAGLRLQIRRLRNSLAQADATCEHRREELLAASQRRKTLERLSDRREQEHTHALAMIEQRELDEIATIRHAAVTRPAA